MVDLDSGDQPLCRFLGGPEFGKIPRQCSERGLGHHWELVSIKLPHDLESRTVLFCYVDGAGAQIQDLERVRQMFSH